MYNEMNMERTQDRVSVVIATYNRFVYVRKAIESVRRQTHGNVEIIMVNDRSTQPEYYTHNWTDEGVTMVHLEQNTRALFGHACAGYVRTVGAARATGTYIAFCDDDDVWLPDKLEKQLAAMKAHGAAMSCTEGYYGTGVYDPVRTYPRYNSEYYRDQLVHIYKSSAHTAALDSGFPTIWTRAFMGVHNCVITSSVVMAADLFERIGGMKNVRNGAEDYGCWKAALEHTDCVYVHEPCVYYDSRHGEGTNH
jgi:glycosyltransferase involved in cell wall biosynthesis